MKKFIPPISIPNLQINGEIWWLEEGDDSRQLPSTMLTIHFPNGIVFTVEWDGVYILRAIYSNYEIAYKEVKRNRSGELEYEILHMCFGCNDSIIPFLLEDEIKKLFDNKWKLNSSFLGRVIIHDGDKVLWETDPDKGLIEVPMTTCGIKYKINNDYLIEETKKFLSNT